MNLTEAGTPERIAGERATENYFAVREALIQAGRADLIGSGCDCLIPAQPPKEALTERRKQANHDYYHAVKPISKPTQRRGPSKGYRPGRKSARRQDKH